MYFRKGCFLKKKGIFVSGAICHIYAREVFKGNFFRFPFWGYAVADGFAICDGEKDFKARRRSGRQKKSRRRTSKAY